MGVPITKIDVLEYLIGQGPGRRQLELAKAIYGLQDVQQQVNQGLTLMVGGGKSSGVHHHFGTSQLGCRSCREFLKQTVDKSPFCKLVVGAFRRVREKSPKTLIKSTIE